MHKPVSLRHEYEFKAFIVKICFVSVEYIILCYPYINAFGLIQGPMYTGADKFYDIIELMIGYRINKWLFICWKFITPAITLVRIKDLVTIYFYKLLSKKFQNEYSLIAMFFRYSKRL